MKNLKYKSFKAQLSDNDNYVEGYASTYGNIDRVGDIVEKGAFAKTIETKNRSAPVRFLWQHDGSRPIGVIEEFKDTAKGLWFRARFSNTTAGRDAREDFKSGTVDRFSIGYQVIQYKDDTVNGRRVKRLTELRLHEISAVTFPANELAMMTAVKAEGGKGELNDTNRSLVLQIIEGLLLAQGSGTDTPEIGPETPVEGEEAPAGDADAAEAKTPADEAQNAENGDVALDEGENDADEGADAGEEALEKPANDASDDEEDEEEAKGKKALEDAISAFRVELALKRALGR